MNCPRCGTDIDSHESGPCLDAWVAECVMGWTDIKSAGLGQWSGVEEWRGRDEPNGGLHGIPKYSTTGDGMLEVVERMFYHTCTTTIYFGSRAYADIVRLTDDRPKPKHGEADTLPLAVCRAAVKACGGAKT